MREFEFTQKFTKEDMIKYNYFAIRFNKGISFNMRFIGFMCLIAGTYLCFSQPSTFLYPIIILILGVFCVFGLVPLYKWVTKMKILKRKTEMPSIKVIVGEKGIIYEFEEEKEQSDTVEEKALSWDMINRAIYEDGNIFVLCADSYIIMIKTSELADFTEMENLFIEKLGLNVRYFNKKNHFFLNKKD